MAHTGLNKRPQRKSQSLIEKEMTECREDIIEWQEKMNDKSDLLAEIDDDLQENAKDHNQLRESFFWFSGGDVLSDIADWYFALLLLFIIPTLEVTFISLEATNNLVQAIMWPVGLTLIQAILLYSIERTKLVLGGNTWPPGDIPDNLSFLSQLPMMQMFKWTNIAALTIWAFSTMINVEIYGILLTNATAKTDAIIAGTTYESVAVPDFWDIAFDTATPWLYGFTVLIAHTTLSFKGWNLFMALSYLFGYRRRDRKHTKNRRGLMQRRRKELTLLNSLYNCYRSELREAKFSFKGFRPPEVIISDRAWQYINEYSAGVGLGGDGQASGLPIDPPPPGE